MPNWSEEVFVIKKVKNTVPWTYFINDLNGAEIIRTFYENYKKLLNKNLGQKKQSRKREINYMSNEKVMIVRLLAGLIKQT